MSWLDTVWGQGRVSPNRYEFSIWKVLTTSEENRCKDQITERAVIITGKNCWSNWEKVYRQQRQLFVGWNPHTWDRNRLSTKQSKEEPRAPWISREPSYIFYSPEIRESKIGQSCVPACHVTREDALKAVGSLMAGAMFIQTMQMGWLLCGYCNQYQCKLKGREGQTCLMGLTNNENGQLLLSIT